MHRMMRPLLAVWTALWLCLLAGSAVAAPQPPAGMHAGAAILMDWQTGQILYQRNANQRRDPASTTKVLTAIVVLERADLTAKVTISKRAANTIGSRMQLRLGEVYSVHDLLHGLLLRSGNDAAVALAEHVSGSVEGFAGLMNEKARQLGAKGSNFVNPHGLTNPGHFSTAHDLALITRHALEKPKFAEIVALRERPLTYEYLHRDVVLHNTNRLLSQMSDVDGVKTGTTAAAGPCLIASATRGDQKLISVVLHAGNRWSESARLLEWGFTNWRVVNFGRQGEVLVQTPVDRGKLLSVPLVLASDLVLVVPKDTALPRIAVQAPNSISAPVKAGQLVGIARLEGVVPKVEVELLAAKAVPKANLLDKLYRVLIPLLRIVHDTEIF